MTYHITPEYLAAFEEAYNKAVLNKQAYFLFNKITYITDLAFYLINYHKLKDMALSEGLSMEEVEEIVNSLADNAPNSRTFILRWWELKKEELRNVTEPNS